MSCIPNNVTFLFFVLIRTPLSGCRQEGSQPFWPAEPFPFGPWSPFFGPRNPFLTRGALLCCPLLLTFYHIFFFTAYSDISDFYFQRRSVKIFCPCSGDFKMPIKYGVHKCDYLSLLERSYLIRIYFMLSRHRKPRPQVYTARDCRECDVSIGQVLSKRSPLVYNSPYLRG